MGSLKKGAPAPLGWGKDLFWPADPRVWARWASLAHGVDSQACRMFCDNEFHGFRKFLVCFLVFRRSLHDGGPKSATPVCLRSLGGNLRTFAKWKCVFFDGTQIWSGHRDTQMTPPLQKNDTCMPNIPTPSKIVESARLSFPDRKPALTWVRFLFGHLPGIQLDYFLESPLILG